MVSDQPPLPAGFETFTMANGWVREEGDGPVRFVRDGGRVVVEGDCEVGPDGHFRRPPRFTVTQRTGEWADHSLKSDPAYPRGGAGLERVWYITTDDTGTQAAYRKTADLVGMLDEAGMLLELQIIDSVEGAAVKDGDLCPGPWHTLSNPSWDEALAWVTGNAAIAGPASEAQLAELEHRLGLELPTDYREFLARTGGVRLVSTDFLTVGGDGEGAIAPATEAARRRGLFDEAVVIAPNIIGGVDVLDLRDGGDPPVVTFDPERYGLLGPDELEDDEEELDGTVEEADNFAEYFFIAVEVSATRHYADQMRWQIRGR